MNDNLRLVEHSGLEQRLDELLAMQIEELCSVASRAVVRPETLTMGEIQEMGWGFLVAVKNLADRAPLLS